MAAPRMAGLSCQKKVGISVFLAICYGQHKILALW